MFLINAWVILEVPLLFFPLEKFRSSTNSLICLDKYRKFLCQILVIALDPIINLDHFLSTTYPSSFQFAASSGGSITSHGFSSPFILTIDQNQTLIFLLILNSFFTMEVLLVDSTSAFDPIHFSPQPQIYFVC